MDNKKRGRPRVEGRVRLVVTVPADIRNDVLRIIRQIRRDYDAARR